MSSVLVAICAQGETRSSLSTKRAGAQGIRKVKAYNAIFFLPLSETSFKTQYYAEMSLENIYSPKNERKCVLPSTLNEITD